MEFSGGFLGQMERFISSVKNGSKYDAVPLSKMTQLSSVDWGDLSAKVHKVIDSG